MALQWQLVDIPAAGGLGEIASRLVRPAQGQSPPLEVVENAEHTRLGTLRKRPGFTSLSTTTASGTISGARGLCSGGDSLTLLDERRAWRFNNELLQWQDRGPVPPGGLRYGQSMSGSRSYDDADTASDGNYTIIAANAQYVGYTLTVNPGAADDTLDETITDVLRVTVLTDAGVTTLPAIDQIVTTTDAARRRSIRCASTGSNLLMCAQKDIGSGAKDIEIYEWLPSSPETQPAIANTITGTKPGSRNYDVIRLQSGDYLIAYIDFTTDDVELEVYSSTHVAGVSATITTTADAVALHQSGGGDIFVAVVDADGVDLYKFDSGLGADYGPINQYTLSGADEDGDSESAHNLSCASDGTSVAVCFGVGNAGIDKARLVYTRALDSTGAKQFESYVHNAAPASRAWVQGGRFYVAGVTFQHRYPFDCGVVFELYAGTTDNPLTDTDQATLAAAYHMGRADRPRGAGSAGNTISGTNKWTWLGFFYSSGQPDTRSAASKVGEARDDSLVGVELVSLDYAAPITCAQTAQDEICIAGSLVTYLGASITEEMGWLVPPCIRDDNQFGSGIVVAEGDDSLVTVGLDDATEYSWTAIWRWVDDNRVIHRSSPAPPSSVTTGTATAGKNWYADLYAKSNGPSNRIITRDATCVWYRSVNGVYRELTSPDGDPAAPMFFKNEGDSSYTTDNAVDIGQGDGSESPLYTTGGVLENVAPAGADVAAVIGDRLWIGGVKRVQYSKKLLPPTEGALRIAPEFNEGFSIQLPGSRRCTGLASLDGRAIVFTETQIFSVIGTGPNDLGAGGTFELQPIAADDGCLDPRSVVAYPDGIFFQGRRGICELTRSLQVQFTGAAVVDQTDAHPTITSAVRVAAKSQIRFTVKEPTGNRDGLVLVYDYLAKAWAVWHLRESGPATIVPNGACMHDGTYHVLDKNGTVWKEDSSTYLDDTDVWVTMKVRTSHLQAAGLNRWQRIGSVRALGTRHTACDLTMSLYHDFATSATRSYTWDEADLDAAFEATVRSQVEMLVARQECTAMAVEIEDAEPTTPGTGQGFELAGFTLELGIERGGALLPEGVR